MMKFAVMMAIAVSFGYLLGTEAQPRVFPADDQALGLAYGCGWTDATLDAAAKIGTIKSIPPVAAMSRACQANYQRALRWQYIK